MEDRDPDRRITVFLLVEVELVTVLITVEPDLEEDPVDDDDDDEEVVDVTAAAAPGGVEPGDNGEEEPPVAMVTHGMHQVNPKIRDLKRWSSKKLKKENQRTKGQQHKQKTM